MKKKKSIYVRGSELKDEFEHMTDWKRVFEKIWQETRWLISYGEINETALRKILKKFVKNFFEIKDNTIKKKLSQIIDEMHCKMDKKMTSEL